MSIRDKKRDLTDLQAFFTSLGIISRDLEVIHVGFDLVSGNGLECALNPQSYQIKYHFTSQAIRMRVGFHRLSLDPAPSTDLMFTLLYFYL